MLTWHDAVQQVLDTVGGQKTGGRNIQAAKIAVQEALQHLPTERTWNYYLSPHRIVTSAQYDTGTITYDHTGGSSERLVTLASGTWPTWAEYGTLLIDSIPYEVNRRLSDTTLTLTASKNPEADVAAGTSYTLYRESYTLPAGFTALHHIDRVADWNGCYVSPLAFQNARESLEYSGQPRVYTIMPDTKDPSRMAFWVYPGSQSSERIDLLFKRRPTLLRVYDYSTGTVTVSVGARTVTGTGSVFTSKMADAAIRFGTTADVPGGINDVDDPYDHEAVIDTFDTTTQLTLKTNAELGSTSVKYRISDRIDVNDGAMQLALMDLARFRYMNITMMSAAQRNAAAGVYTESLRAAARQDQNSPPTNGPSMDPYTAARVYDQVSIT
jgi:hypothetical protein